MLGEAPYPWFGDVWDRFGQSLAQSRLGHAVLIVGPAGVGKLALAESASRALLCRERGLGRVSAPCGVCDACVQVERGSHPDLHRVEADDKTGVIGVGAVREICAQLLMTSQMAGYRVGLFPNVERCSVSAANSLLKTLEEPPPNVFMVLVSARPGRLPATIRSRCQVWRCPAPAPTQAAQWLREQGVQDADAALDRAGGAPLMALQVSGDPLSASLDAVLAATLTGQVSVAQAAKQLEPYGSEAVLSGVLMSIDTVLASGADHLASGLQIACFGGSRSARQLYAWRDAVLREFVRDRTGLNELATLERVLAAGRGEAPAAVT